MSCHRYAPTFRKNQQRAIRAELIGSDVCHGLGVTARGAAPVLALCRALIDAGCDPERPLIAYRGRVLAITVRSIGEAADLDINSKGTNFVRRRSAVRTTPPVRKNASVHLLMPSGVAA